MRYLVKVGKPIAILLSFLISGPILLSPLAISAAHGQFVAPPRWKVAVVDFRLGRGVGAPTPDLVKKVEERMYLALKAVGQHQVISPREVESEIAAMGVSPPYQEGALKLLCKALGVDGVVRGTITSVGVDKAGRASISLDVELWDAVSEEAVSGAEWSGVTPPHPGYKGDVSAVLDEAIANACTEVAMGISTKPIIEGTVLVVDAFENVYINIGDHDGVKEGMQLVVLDKRWSGQPPQAELLRVGVIRAVKVTPKDSICRVVRGEGSIREGRAVRGIYERPPAPGLPLISTSKHNVGTLLMSLLAIWGIVSIIGNSNAAIEAITSIQARATSVVDNGVQVQWTPRASLPQEPAVIGSEILGYIVYRSENPFIEGDFTAVRKVVLGAALSHFIDDSRLISGSVGVGVNDNGLVSETNSEAVRSVSEGGRLGVTALRPAYIPMVPAWATAGKIGRFGDRGGTGSGRGKRAILPATVALTRQGYANTLTVYVNSQGTVPGTHYFYAVQCISKFQVFGGASGGTITIGTSVTPTEATTTRGRMRSSRPAGGGSRLGGRGAVSAPQRQETIPRRFVIALSNFSSVVGPVTPLARPVQISPASIPDPGSSDVSAFGADFRWNSVAGADTYVLQIADNIAFNNAFTSDEISFGGEAAGVLLSQNVSIFKIFATSASKFYYWRVGARYSGDVLRPAPDGYVFSKIGSFRTAELPPPPPKKG